MPDGSVAKVKLDFEVLRAISDCARRKYGLGGTVQHGASTLPDEMFHRFPESGAVEVHLATGFQNLIYDHPDFPEAFKAHIYEHLKSACAKERKEGETDEQFFYKTRKKGFGGSLKREWWSLPAGVRQALGAALENKFAFLIQQLGVAQTRDTVARFIKAGGPAPDRDADRRVRGCDCGGSRSQSSGGLIRGIGDRDISDFGFGKETGSAVHSLHGVQLFAQQGQGPGGIMAPGEPVAARSPTNS